MKIFTAQQIREGDAFTIRQEKISSADLMERAARKCFEWIAENIPYNTPILTVCGMGNNGGDGLALTRILLQEGYSAKAVVLKLSDSFSPDASLNFTRLHQLAPDNIKMLSEGMFITDLPERILIVEALFGTGFEHLLSGWAADFLMDINALPNRVVSIDIPGGLPSDALPDKNAAVVKADDTLSFQFYKRSFLHPEAGPYVGNVHVLDIGINERFIRDTHTQYYLNTLEVIQGIYRPREAFSHKGNYGKALLIGGQQGMAGAIHLSAKAALRSGAGLVKILAPEIVCDVLQVALPEAITLSGGQQFIEAIELPEEKLSIGIGPGLGIHPQTKQALYHLLEQLQQPVVLDADALNLIAEDKEMLNLLPAHSILTPHPKEFERLFGVFPDSMLQTEWARGVAMKYNIVLVLKGHHTAVLMPDGSCWYNTSGNAGMATGGSGDVLTGILTSLLAQGYTSREAALLGVYLHGRSGDIYAAQHSQEALIARDIIDNLGKAFLELRNNTEEIRSFDPGWEVR